MDLYLFLFFIGCQHSIFLFFFLKTCPHTHHLIRKGKDLEPKPTLPLFINFFHVRSYVRYQDRPTVYGSSSTSIDSNRYSNYGASSGASSPSRRWIYMMPIVDKKFEININMKSRVADPQIWIQHFF